MEPRSGRPPRRAFLFFVKIKSLLKLVPYLPIS